MNFQDLSTRYQISIGKILVKYNLDWDDIPSSAEKALQAKQEIIMMLITDRILSTADIAKLLMTTPDQIGKIYNSIIKSRTKPPITETPKKNKLNKNIMDENPKTDDKNWLENHKGATPNEENPNPNIIAEGIHKQPLEINNQNPIFETLVLEKERVEKHLKAIEFLMEFYK